jgi:hypothetical protein
MMSFFCRSIPNGKTKVKNMKTMALSILTTTHLATLAGPDRRLCECCIAHTPCIFDTDKWIHGLFYDAMFL